MNGEENTNIDMTQPVHDFFFTVGVGTTAGIGYYYWNNVYPITLERFITDMAWWGLRMQTQTNIYWNDLCKSLNPFIRMFFAEPERNDVRFYKSGVEICSMPYLEALKYNEEIHGNYDKVSYEIEDDDGNLYLILRDNVDDITDRDIKKSNSQFINVTLKREGKEDIDVDMKSRGNIYMVGNELFTREFFEWLCPNIELSDNYVVSTIDNNVNIVEFTSEQYLLLNNNGYEIKKVIDEEPKSEEETTEQTPVSSWSFGSLFSKSKDD